jgi:hypothetical protein
MKKQQITFIPVWLLMTLGTAASPFAHDTSTAAQGGNEEKHSTMLGPVRTINTIEVTDFSQYGSYASWPTLLERHAKGLKEWLVTFYSQDTNGHFRETQEILGLLQERA